VYETIKKLLRMVDKIIDPAIAEGRATDQLLVLTVFREIITCDAVYKKFLDGRRRLGRSRWPRCALSGTPAWVPLST